ncbi:MAG: EFR1 family ferrodoxin [Lachnospiraceae bacterium]|nr:EFR1 family ferrodoxin [Lachnospiraceae bacterium]
MILYFSATGNTEFVSKKLASYLNDDCINLLDRIKGHDYSEIYSEKPFVICAPIYVCELPRFFASYIKNVILTGSRDVYFVLTSGGYTGIGGVLAKKMIRNKGMNFKGYDELKMPRNYIASDTYSELTEDEIIRRITDSEGRIPKIAEKIRNGSPLKARHVWLFELLITLPFNPIWCRFGHGVKKFYAGDKCIGCQKCAKLCPLNIIHIENRKPVWNGSSCAHCMSCIQNCPTEAIEYGNITQKKKRYVFRKYKT